MEIHTPNNPAGHTTGYLKGLINTIYIDKLKVNPEQFIPNHGVTISYLDYVTAEVDDNVQIGLKVFNKAVPKQEHRIKCAPAENPARQIQEHVADEVLEKILELSNKNKENMSEHFPTGLDIKLTGENPYMDKRKVISRILTASNMIATHGRRGPANFIIIGKDYVNYIRQDVQDNVAFQSIDEIGNMTYGLNVFVSGKLGNTVVVGRCSNEDNEPGIHLITTTDDISGHVIIKNNDIHNVDVVYMLEATGSTPERGYLQFNIIDNVN